MSDTSSHHTNVSQNAMQGDAHTSTQAMHAAAPVQPQPGAHSAEQATRQHAPLSGLLRISIAMLSLMTLLTITLLFVGNVSAGGTRVFLTFVLYIVFVGLTSIDTRIARSSAWYAPFSVAANAYMLMALLVVIWTSTNSQLFFGWELFWTCVYVIFVMRFAVFACVLLVRLTARTSQRTLNVAVATGATLMLAAALITAPVALDAFGLVIPALYWKIVTALVVLTGLGVSVTFLLSWNDRGQDRKTRATAVASHQPPAAVPYSAPAAAPAVQTAPAAQSTAGDLLPWPTFADGRPLPFLPNGQPDFSALTHQQ